MPLLAITDQVRYFSISRPLNPRSFRRITDIRFISHTSGKSTLANVLLRIFDFDSGQLLINGIDIRSFDPEDYHSHITTLFQTFSKFNASVRENVGIGDIKKEFKDSAVNKAACEAGASSLVQSLPKGLDTQLECIGNDFPPPYTPGTSYSSEINARHGLSGGEVRTRFRSSNHFPSVTSRIDFTVAESCDLPRADARKHRRLASFR